jgi:hypothetical protein
MIDVNDLNSLDCDQAEDDLMSIEPDLGEHVRSYESYQNLLIFISKVKNLQRKYTKPVAALLKKDN